MRVRKKAKKMRAMKINRLVKSLLNFTLLSLSCLIASAQAEDNNERVIAQINELMASSSIESAYGLAQKHQELDVLIRLKFAQLSLILGHETAANSLFTELGKDSSLTLRQKENLKYFLARFNLSLKKKLKFLEKQVDTGRCKQVEYLQQYLTQFQLTKVRAQAYSSSCKGQEREISLRLGGLLGFDSNVALTNEEILPNNTPLIEGYYQDWSLLIRSKPLANRTKSEIKKEFIFSWIPSYYSSSREYDSQVASRYDHISHKAQLELKLKQGFGFNWRLPLYYRYTEYAGKPYSTSYGSKLSFSRSINQFKHQASLHIRQRNYSDTINQGRDNRLFDLGYQLVYSNKPMRIITRMNQQTLTGTRNINDRYQATHAGLKFLYRLSNKLAANMQPRFFAGYTLKSKRYQGLELGKQRNDMRQDYRIGLSLTNKQWRIKTQYSYQQRESNIQNFDFQRKKFELGIQYEF